MHSNYNSNIFQKQRPSDQLSVHHIQIVPKKMSSIESRSSNERNTAGRLLFKKGQVAEFIIFSVSCNVDDLTH